MKKLFLFIFISLISNSSYASDFTTLYVILFAIFMSMLLTITAIFSVIFVSKKAYVDKSPAKIVNIAFILIMIGTFAIFSESSHMGDGDLIFSLLSLIVPGVIAILPPLVQYRSSK